ncbi:SGNH/GDSL hydrolase family protein [Verrucomicrobiales bacterium]|nr:SGNH/GDSL hydrolase family protein [Verrucomicrobiales bacterium]
MRHTTIIARLAIGLVLVFGIANLFGYPLTLDQRERFKRYIPRSFAKLEAGDPVHIVAIGDGVMGGITPLPSAWESGNPLFSYTGMFLTRLAREFFYTGGVKLLNPPDGGSAKVSAYLGNEITLENLTTSDGNALDGLRRAATDAFVHDPDLLLVQFGIFDSFGYLSIDSYQLAIQEIINAGKAAKTDVIIFSPTLVNFGEGAMEWGITRPYATAAREVAARNEVLFMDLGGHQVRLGGGVDPATQPQAGMQVIGDKLTSIFKFGPDLPTRERVHPAMKANEYLGEVIFDDLKNGPRVSKFTYAAVAAYENNSNINVTVAITNQSSEPQEGSIGALAVGRSIIPVDIAQRFKVDAGETTQLLFRYQRPLVGKSRDGSDLFYPIAASDELGRFSFVLEDTIGAELVDLPVRMGPVTAMWKSRHYINVSNKLRIEWDLVSGYDKPVSGTFRVGMGEKVGPSTPFSVSPLGTKTVFSIFDFEGGNEAQSQNDVWIQVEADGRKVRFTREMEATKDLVLGEPIAMRAWSDYANARPAGTMEAKQRPEGKASWLFDADEKALYAIARLEGFRIPDMGDKAAIQVRLFLDARSSDGVCSFGAIEPVEVYTKATDGPGLTSAIRLGSFGAGYNMVLSAKGVASTLDTADDGAKLLTIRIPRSYLHEHEWDLDSIDSVLGFRAELTIADSLPDATEPFPSRNRYETSSPSFAFDGRPILGFHENDARALSTLRLSRTPVNSWSVRIY